MDVVYTWVDGAFPGYGDLLSEWAESDHDVNPNRYRDNLDLLKYSLRSLERHAPWVRHVYLVTTRPQVPTWLAPDAPDLTVLHHDAIFDPENLPSFNSFAILAHLTRIPGVSQRFLYMEDDRLFGRDVGREHLFTPDGRSRLYAKLESTNHGREYESADASPWEGSLAWSNHLLDEAYGSMRRGSIKHAPFVFDVEHYDAFCKRFEPDVARTRSSRFRGHRNVVTEHMYPYYLLHEGRAVRVPLWQAYRDCSYIGLDNFWPWQAVGLAHLRARHPRFYCMNDNYGESPHPRSVAMVKRWLERAYPEASRFER